MANLITVFSCDDCGEIIGLKTDEDWQQFSEVWADSLKHQFCPECKKKISNRALMEMDARFIEAVVGADYQANERKEYIN